MKRPKNFTHRWFTADILAELGWKPTEDDKALWEVLSQINALKTIEMIRAKS